MKKAHIRLLISLLLLCAIAVNTAGCGAGMQAKDLMKGIISGEVSALADLSTGNEKVTDFAVRLFKASEKSGENTLISPLSVLLALSMTANGAEGKTLEQMQAVLGMTTEKLNQYVYSYMKDLPRDEKNKLYLANSIWFTDDKAFTVKQEFLQTVADYYGADIFKVPFNEQTCKDINRFVEQNTDGMIPEILDQISEEAVMYLVNALAFEAEWEKVYEKNQVREGVFTKEDGKEQKAEFMYGSEELYLEDDKATGFMKYYKDEKYAFAVMLPRDGVSVSEYVGQLDGKALNELLRNPQYVKVQTSIPKFETGYDVEMSDILKGMGMTDAFDGGRADFEGLGTSEGGNIFISRVIHKTFISVGEQGTKAGAATVVETYAGSMGPAKETKVYLDRPFVYMLIDCENHIPLFIGTMMDVEK